MLLNWYKCVIVIKTEKNKPKKKKHCYKSVNRTYL